MDKLKLIYNLLPIPLSIMTVFVIYLAYNCWQNEKASQGKVTELTNEIVQTKQKTETDNQIAANNEQDKVKPKK